MYVKIIVYILSIIHVAYSCMEGVQRPAACVLQIHFALSSVRI